MLCIFFFSCNSQPENKINQSENKNAIPENGFAVVELFTSQGCSSCPIADKLLGKFIEQYSNAGKRLIALSFHVDYWDKLGWKDPFSQHIFSERQSSYSAQLKLENVYTPQVIVNGQSETVGSNEKLINQFINKGFTEKNITNLSIKDTQLNPQKIGITYILENLKDGLILNFAIVQNKVTTKINAGENDGVTLSNYNIVRSWKAEEASSAGEHFIDLEIPKGYNTNDFSIIVFAQQKENGKIIAVDKK